MVNLKTKIDKHANDNEKRRKSIKEKEKAKFNQSKIIKNALSDSNTGANVSKKIIFSDNDEDGVDVENKEYKNNCSSNGKPVLFDASESDGEDFELKEKTQFSGKKGFELLNLQSTYGNDERFKIDERFLEDSPEGVNEGKNIDNDTSAGEKAQQLKILDSVLGTSSVSPEKEKKAKKRTYEMIRYDASNKDHEIYKKNIEIKAGNSIRPKGRREKKIMRTDKEDLPKPKVSKDKFYEVSSEIKSSFKEKQNESAQFSLLQTYGANGVESNQDEEEEVELEQKKLRKDGSWRTDDSTDQMCGSRDGGFEEELHAEEKMMQEKPKADEKSVVAKGIWKESFFFVKDDLRFKEGLEFINKKESPEAIEAGDNYDKTRKKLREILRLHLKKQIHKKDPFKNKVGGMNKKQLANSKFRNSKMSFNKRRS